MHPSKTETYLKVTVLTVTHSGWFPRHLLTSSAMYECWLLTCITGDLADIFSFWMHALVNVYICGHLCVSVLLYHVCVYLNKNPVWMSSLWMSHPSLSAWMSRMQPLFRMQSLRNSGKMKVGPTPNAPQSEHRTVIPLICESSWPFLWTHF